MDPTPKSSPDAAPVSTLGDLLYSDRSASVVAEEDWVALVRAIAAGDQQSMRNLYERSHRLVFTLAMRLSGSREIAEEVTLDVFHDVWSRAKSYDPVNGSVVGWIMNQARSRAIDRLRFEQRRKRRPADGDVGTVEPPETPELAASVDAERRRVVLQEALTALTPEERQVVETAFFAELTYSETADRLAQPVGTVKTRIRSALAKLRKLLPREGGES